jgi:hypothetical protein
VVAPIDVLVDLHEGDRPMAVQRSQNRDGNAMVTADHDRQGAGGEDLPDCGFGASVVAFRIADISCHVAAIDGPD